MYIIDLLLTNLYCKGPQKMANILQGDNTTQNKQTNNHVGGENTSVSANCTPVGLQFASLGRDPVD